MNTEDDKNETAHGRTLRKMTDAELLAYAAGAGEANPVWSLLYGARQTAKTLRGAVLWDGSIGDVHGFGVDEAAIDAMFCRLDRELEALEQVLIRRHERPEPAASTKTSGAMKVAATAKKAGNR